MEGDDEEASSRDRKSGAGEDRGHSSRALSNMSAIHDEPYQVGDDTKMIAKRIGLGPRSILDEGAFDLSGVSTYPG